MKKYMLLAVKTAQKGLKKGAGGPFGACIIKKGRVIAAAHNEVLKSQDPTCHAEMQAIRLAAKKLKSFDLSGCEIYSTTEPCPMCFAAIHWARITKVFYGTSIRDVTKRGFNELAISNAKLKQLGKLPMLIHPGFERKSCLDLLIQWDRLKLKVTY